MKLDVTKLPLGEALIGFVFAAVAVTFVLAFTLPSDAGIEDVEPEDGEAVAEETPADGETADGEGTVVDVVMIPTIQFDTVDVTVPAGQTVTLTADNQDTGIIHNWALYTDESASEQLAATELCIDCTETITFDPPEPGVYFFRCDVHPIQMVGTFVVE